MGYSTSARNIGFEQIATLSSATGFTTATMAGAGRALVTVETQTVRWRDDGSNPTTTVGHRLSPGDILDYDGSLGTIKFIEENASAKINVSYFAT